jgi:putative sugar O-methyltransferase
MNPEAQPFYDRSALEAGIQPRPLPPVDAAETGLLKRVKEFYCSIKRHQPAQPEIYQPAGEWREHVNHRMPHYAAFHDESVDRLASLLGGFWRNELGVLVKQYAGHRQLLDDAAERARYAEWMAYDLMIWTHLFHADLSELAIPEIGHPWGYLWQGTLIGSKVLRYHALKTQIVGLTSDLNRPVVAEIGAGYGGMAYFLMRTQEARVYIDFDLPETLAVAAYHLSKALPHRRVYLHDGGPVEWDRVLKEFDVLLMPNWFIGTLPEASVDVFLNTFSLSEMSRPVIEHYLGRIAIATRHYFLHNNMDRAGVINEGHERTPGSQYPFPAGALKLIGKHYDLFQQKHSGRDGDYREFLYQRTTRTV